MNTQQICEAFFSDTFTQADARRRLRALETIVSYIQSHHHISSEQIATLDLRPDDRSFLASLLSSLPKSIGAHDLNDILASLAHEVSRRPVCALTVAFEPTSDQARLFGTWIRSQVDPRALLSIVVSPEIVGGCVIAWQGREVSYTLSSLLEASKKDILESIERYSIEYKQERATII